MKTAVSIPDALFEAGEAAARRLGWSRSRLYAQALAKLIDEAPDDDTTARLDAVYATEDSRLDPVLAEIQRQSLAPEA